MLHVIWITKEEGYNFWTATIGGLNGGWHVAITITGIDLLPSGRQFSMNLGTHTHRETKRQTAHWRGSGCKLSLEPVSVRFHPLKKMVVL